MAINFSFFFIASLILILCQTIIFPGNALCGQGGDALFIVVIHMSLVFSHYGVVGAILVLGAAMDSLSGGAFFIHIFSYLWVYIIVKLFRRFVFHSSALFVMGVSLAAVAIQQGLVIYSVFVSQGHAGLRHVDYSLVVTQMVCGGVFIPIGVWFLNLIRQNWMVFFRQFHRSLLRKYRD